MTEYIIQTQNLSKKYKNHYAVKNLNINIPQGKIYGLLGKNGAGKTTTMAMILKLAKPTKGEIKINLENNKEIGSIIETPGFYNNLTAEENLKLISKLRGNYDKNRINNILKLVKLDKTDKQFKNYSLGMKQRLAIASAIIHNPKILILDEPINGLDPIGIKDIRNLLKTLSTKYNTTILISSHILSEIETISDVIGIMSKGKLIEEINMKEFHQKTKKHVIISTNNLKKSKTILNNMHLKENTDYTITDKIKLTNHIEKRSKILENLIKNNIEVNECKIIEEDLEQYFTKIINKEE